MAVALATPDGGYSSGSKAHGGHSSGGYSGGAVHGGHSSGGHGGHQQYEDVRHYLIMLNIVHFIVCLL